MSAPVSEHARALDQLARALTAVLASAAERQARPPAHAVDHATADYRRPLGADARPTTHEDRVSALQERDAAFEGDESRDPLTTPDA
jgi:hypothetical protein